MGQSIQSLTLWVTALIKQQMIAEGYYAVGERMKLYTSPGQLENKHVTAVRIEKHPDPSLFTVTTYGYFGSELTSDLVDYDDIPEYIYNGPRYSSLNEAITAENEARMRRHTNTSTDPEFDFI